MNHLIATVVIVIVFVIASKLVQVVGTHTHTQVELLSAQNWTLMATVHSLVHICLLAADSRQRDWIVVACGGACVWFEAWYCHS